MALTNTSCRDALKESLRAQPAIGDNVDLDEVRPNVEAIADAIRVIVATLADGVSDASVDPAFWAWIGAVDAWLGSLYAWQQAAELALGTGVAVAPPPAAPTSLAVNVR